MILGLLDLILKFTIFSDFCRFFMIFATFCLILHKFWANKLSKILIYIESTNDSMLLILRCPRAIIKEVVVIIFIVRILEILFEF
jgi:hypothetical protein